MAQERDTITVCYPGRPAEGFFLDDKDSIIIGRAEDKDLEVFSNTRNYLRRDTGENSQLLLRATLVEASRQQVKLVKDKGRYYLVVLSDAIETCLNGKPLSPYDTNGRELKYTFNFGDKISFGDFVVQLFIKGTQRQIPQPAYPLMASDGGAGGSLSHTPRSTTVFPGLTPLQVSAELEAKGVRLNTLRRTVSFANKEVGLSKLLFNTLHYLAYKYPHECSLSELQGVLYTAIPDAEEMVIGQVKWQAATPGATKGNDNPGENTKVTVQRLRKALEDNFQNARFTIVLRGESCVIKVG